MKRIILYFATVTVMLTSCMDVLDKTKLDAVSEDFVWGDAVLSTAYVNTLYTYIPVFDNTLADPTDEATGGGTWISGSLSPDSPIRYWNYDHIRQMNIFINTIQDRSITTIDETLANRLALEGRFIRAYTYFELVKRYGGVPILTEAQGLTDNFDDLLVSRESTKNCFEFIVNELKACIDGLPESYDAANLGRVTKGAAMAFLGRVYLFRASKQFNPNNTKEHWDMAYSYNKQTLDYLTGKGHGLIQESEMEYGDIFLNEMHKEVVFAIRYVYPGRTHTEDARIRPITHAQNNTGGNHPIQKVIDSWPTAEGKKFALADLKEGQDITDLWENRDKRFYSVIVYHGSQYLDVPYMYMNENAQNGYAYGKNNGSKTGYYSKKWINQSYTVTEASNSGTDYIDIRFAEVMLNFAEAAVETGNLSEAFSQISQIRERAGIAKTVADDPELAGKEYGLDPSMNQAIMRQAVRDERYIELLFERKRLWDLRRWGIYHEVMTGQNKRFALILEEQEDKSLTYRLFDRDNTPMITDERIYFLPLSQSDELNKNSKLEQNKGWGGTFDPLEGM